MLGILPLKEDQQDRLKPGFKIEGQDYLSNISDEYWDISANNCSKHLSEQWFKRKCKSLQKLICVYKLPHAQKKGELVIGTLDQIGAIP